MTGRADRAGSGAAAAASTAPATVIGGLTPRQAGIKRCVDLVGAVVGLVTTGWTVPLLALLARRSTNGTGIFRQPRVGRAGTSFQVLKLRTMRVGDEGTTVTASDDPRITKLGQFLRRWKLDELPQLWNVLRGEMSLVGPRPDVAEFVELEGEQAALILSVAPGITGPATLVFRDEETLLATQPRPEDYNRDVLVPTKARINEHYVRTWGFWRDLRYVFLTLRGASMTMEEAMR